MMRDKVAALLGFAQAAGKIASGESGVRSAVLKKKARLVLLAADASPNTRKAFLNLITHRGVLLREYSTKGELGRMIGKAPRSVVAVLDSGFAKVIIESLRGEHDM
ncbi:MAG: L7Ae/L30e/S12e/Gadd45 family ribosomal protein [bacterium]